MPNTKNSAGTVLPQAFTFNASNQQVRTVTIDGEPYFVAADVCSCLQLSNNRQAVATLDDDEKRVSVVMTPLGGPQSMTVLNESGLYNLIFQSRKPEAKAFRKWVTSEVLPALRKTGEYRLPQRRSLLYVRPKDYIDLRSVPYSSEPLNGYPVRRIVHNDVAWYSLNDILRSLRVATSSYQVAAMLNGAGRALACKIHIFGNTHPAWFTTLTGLQLVISGSRKFKQTNGGR